MLERYPERVNPGLVLWISACAVKRQTFDHNRGTHMRAMRAEQFSGYEGLT